MALAFLEEPAVPRVAQEMPSGEYWDIQESRVQCWGRVWSGGRCYPATKKLRQLLLSVAVPRIVRSTKEILQTNARQPSFTNGAMAWAWQTRRSFSSCCRWRSASCTKRSVRAAGEMVKKTIAQTNPSFMCLGKHDERLSINDNNIMDKFH